MVEFGQGIALLSSFSMLRSSRTGKRGRGRPQGGALCAEQSFSVSARP